MVACIATGGCPGTQDAYLATIVSTAIAFATRKAVKPMVAALNQTAVACFLINLRGNPIPVRDGLVDIGSGLLSVRARLFGIGERLFTISVSLTFSEPAHLGGVARVALSVFKGSPRDCLSYARP